MNRLVASPIAKTMDKELACEYSRVHTFGLVLLFRWKHMSYRHLAMVVETPPAIKYRRRKITPASEKMVSMERYDITL